MITDPAEVFRLGTEKAEENLAFRRYLAAHHIRETAFQILASDMQQKIDCMACGNCCRNSVVPLGEADIRRIAAHLGTTAETVTRLYAVPDPESPRSHILLGTREGCVFLDGNLCMIYEARPKTCREFPHVQAGTHSLGGRPSSLARWAALCPIIYNALEEFKHVTGYNRHRHGARYSEEMQAIQPDQAGFLLRGVYLPGLKNEHRLTRTVIEAIPLDKGDYRPDSVSRSALELAWHIVTTEIRFMDAVAAGAFDLSPMPRPDTVRNSAELVAWYTEHFQQRFEKLVGLTDDQLVNIVDFRGMFQLPAVSYLNFLLHHSIHHRGQLSMYLRPTGAKVPSIYGESYDAAEARKAASPGSKA